MNIKYEVVIVDNSNDSLKLYNEEMYFFLSIHSTFDKSDDITLCLKNNNPLENC